ncbi:phosphoribosyltransferase family protein [Streptomyces sp. NPDC093085]|uniref:phosphoribosyltransferase n=1 Tax=Streptomyces sp. NPDC093085 TaxID=3155068 RepID=UPI003449497D
MSSTSLWRRERLLLLGWPEVGKALTLLADEVRDSGFRPTVIVGIARGGLPPAVALSNLLGVQDFRIFSIPRNTSNSRYSERGEPTLSYTVPDRPMTGADVLIVDDIMGDGGTMALAVRTAQNLGAAAVRTVVLVRNIHAAGHPDHQALEVDDWTVFPWERPPGHGESHAPVPGPA